MKYIVLMRKEKSFLVSILLIVELAFEACISATITGLAVLFQSFLSWNWLLKTCQPWYVQKRWISFNPSYRGIGFWSNYAYVEPNAIQWFQSFLSWNWLLKINLAGNRPHPRTGFQSFLSWNWLLKKVYFRNSASVICCFNPSYRGIGFWRSHHGQTATLCLAVSILLIVELAFEGRSVYVFHSYLKRFQSFLSWNWLLKPIRLRFS